MRRADRRADALALGPVARHAIAGNAVEILENGAFFDALLEEIGAARHSVHFETFLWKDGVLGQRLVDALAERARAGVQVRVLVDANGGKKMGEARARQLREAGCKLAIFHPRTLRNIGVFNQRDHRKIVVVDGRVALVGGHCIVDGWLGDGRTATTCATSRVRLRGPIVHAVQSVFSENWVEETGELFVGDDVFPPLEPAGDVAVARREHQARRLGAGGEDPAPPGDLLRAQAALDPEPLLPARARGDRCVRRGGRSAASTCA